MDLNQVEDQMKLVRRFADIMQGKAAPPRKGTRMSRLYNVFLSRFNRVERRNLDNSPDRAKGMKPFEIDGRTIYAGTYKAAVKKARLLAMAATNVQ